MRLASSAKLRRSVLKVESLEARVVPASFVDIAISGGGLLSLIGNDEPSGLTLLVEAAQVTATPDATTDVGNGPGVAKIFLGSATSLLADMKGGRDFIDIDGAADFKLTGAAKFKMGDGNSDINLSTAGKIELGSLSVLTGDGADTVTIAPGAGLGSTVSGNASFDFKVGLGNLTMSDVEVHGSGGVKVKVAKNGGSSLVDLTKVMITKTLDVNSNGAQITDSTLGGIKVKGWAVSATLDTNTTVNGNVSLSSSKFLSVLELDTSTINGKVSLSAPNQSNLILKDSKITGDTKIKGNFFASMTAYDASEAGNIRISSGLASRFTANTSGIVSMKINGNLSVTGNGNALVEFGTLALSEVTGNVNIKAGFSAGSLLANEQVKFGKDVSVEMGNLNGKVSIGDGTLPVAILGNLKIRGGSGTSLVELNSVVVGTPAAPKNTSIKVGAGADVVSINEESVFTGKFDADLGAGDDLFAVAQILGSTAPVTFTGKVTVKTGTGNDTLLLGRGAGAGGDAFTEAVFNGAGSKIDGGSGFNLFDNLPDIANFSGAGLPLASILSFTDP